MTIHPDARSVIASARQALSFARLGASDFAAGGDRADSGLHNAITNGRQVTFVLRNLQSASLYGAAFTAWYDEAMAPMRSNLRDKWFVELRNRIEKQGAMGLENDVLASFYSSTMMREMGPPPAGAAGFFIVDQLGRSGWFVNLPDGSKTTVYVSTPTGFVTTLSTQGAPAGFDLNRDLEPWLDALENIIDQAEARWVTEQPSGSGTATLPDGPD